MSDTDKAFFTITPLGGYGEIGLNCTIWQSNNSCVLVDCGLMFPDDYHLGIDVVIPRFEALLAHKDEVRGIVLTHGHEDHIGALPWLVPFLQVPIYASRFTLALVEAKLREHDLLHKVTLIPVDKDTILPLGDLTFHFFPVCHSIIDGFALGVETPIGRVIHTGDFKIDNDPQYNQCTDMKLFADFAGKNGVRLLFSDSTNIERDGHSVSERDIVETFTKIFTEAKGRIIITLFSSHIQRIQEVFDLAAQFGRKVATSGRSLSNNVELARELDYMHVANSVYVDVADINSYPDEQVVLLVTGSQGEPLSALSRIASGEHRQLSIHEHDTVVMSSRFIPGNTRAITRLINQLYRMGAEVFYENVQAIHASGHAHREELRLMLETVKPRYFVPVHGEYRHLVKHKRLAVETGVMPERAIILEDGNPITFYEDGIRLEDRVNVETVLVDGKGVGDVGQAVLRERHILGDEGMVVVLMVIDETSWEILVGPNLFSKGFVFEQQYNHVLEDAKCVILEIFESIKPGDLPYLQDRVRGGLRRFFRNVLDRDPVVIPAVTLV